MKQISFMLAMMTCNYCNILKLRAFFTDVISLPLMEADNIPI